jgi:hypothetical protein
MPGTNTAGPGYGRLVAALLLAPLPATALYATTLRHGFNIIAFVQSLPSAYALGLAVGLPLSLLLMRRRRVQLLPAMLGASLGVALLGTLYHAWDLQRAIYVRQRTRELVIDGRFTPEGLHALLGHAGMLLLLGAVGAVTWWLVARPRVSRPR